MWPGNITNTEVLSLARFDISRVFHHRTRIEARGLTARQTGHPFLVAISGAFLCRLTWRNQSVPVDHEFAWRPGLKPCVGGRRVLDTASARDERT